LIMGAEIRPKRPDERLVEHRTTDNPDLIKEKVISTMHDSARDCRTGGPVSYRNPYILRAEVSHADDRTPERLRELPGVILIQSGRAGELPTTVATILISAIAPCYAIDVLRSALTTIRSDDFNDWGDGRTAQLVRCGWLTGEELLADLTERSWNWDTIAHDCADHAKRIVRGMYLPDREGWEDETVIGGCMPSGPDHQCRICGCQW
jgi:hypothetical protein